MGYFKETDGLRYFLEKKKMVEKKISSLRDLIALLKLIRR